MIKKERKKESNKWVNGNQWQNLKKKQKQIKDKERKEKRKKNKTKEDNISNK